MSDSGYMRAPVAPMGRRTWLRRAGALVGAGLAGGRLGAQSASLSPTAPAVAGEWAARYPDLKLINLAGNENPFGPSQRVVLAIMKAVPQSCRYPFREEQILTEMLAAREGVDPECIVLGNGCDEILAMAGAAFGAPGTEVVATEPTYLQIMEHAEHHGAEVRWVPHTAAMHHDLAAMERAVGDRTRLVYVCNPDTPSGTLCPPDAIRGFCEAVAPRAAVFLDEVYLDLLDDFEAQTQVELVRQGLPIIIGRSFSKMHALAGHRVGYAVTTPDLAKRLSHERMSSMNFLGVAAARESLLDTSFHAFSRRKIREERTRYTGLLEQLGLKFTPSVGNFVFHHTGVPIREFQARCKEAGFLVGRPFPPYEDWCRVSIGSPDEMRAFAPVLRRALKG